MCTPLSMQRKLIEHYEGTGQQEKADLQRRSLENTISVIEQREAIRGRQSFEKKQQEHKSFIRSPSSNLVIKVLCAVAVIFLGGSVFFYNKNPG